MDTCQYRPSSRWFRCRGTTTDWDLGLPRKRQKRANAMRMGSIRPPVREILWAPKTIFGRPDARQNDCSAPFPPTSSQVLRLHPAESAKILVEQARQGKQSLGRCGVGGAHASPVSALLTMRICHALPLRIDFGLLELFGISYFKSVQPGQFSAASVSHSLPRIASATSLVFSHFSPAGPTHDGQPCSQLQPAINSWVLRSRISCARYSGSLNPIPPGYASYRYKFGSKNSFISAGSVVAVLNSCHSLSIPGLGGRSPTAVPRSRRSHISSRLAIASSAYSSPKIPLCRSDSAYGNSVSSGPSTVIQNAVVCISFSGNSSFPAPIFSFVKNLIFLNPTTCERTSTSPCTLAAGPAMRASSATSSTRTCV